MRFSALQRRVKRAEQVVVVRMDDTQHNWSQLGQAWQTGWTPLRIVVAGLAGGFVAGKLELPGKLNGARWLQMITSVSNLFTGAQAAFASAMAAHAAGTAEDAANQADAAATKADDAATTVAAQDPIASAAASHRDMPRGPSGAGPRPAEAATELSER
ncbi:protein sip-5 [Xanthomonas sp. 60]